MFKLSLIVQTSERNTNCCTWLFPFKELTVQVKLTATQSVLPADSFANCPPENRLSRLVKAGSVPLFIYCDLNKNLNSQVLRRFPLGSP